MAKIYKCTVAKRKSKKLNGLAEIPNGLNRVYFDPGGEIFWIGGVGVYVSAGPDTQTTIS